MVNKPLPFDSNSLFAAHNDVLLFPSQNNWFLVIKQNKSKAFSVIEEKESNILLVLVQQYFF